MLEAALEQLLLRFLAPYVDGISKDKLHVGVFRGSLELKELSIQPEALALLGWEGLEVRQGSIGLIKLAIPWSSLYTGKIRAVVRGVHLEIDQLSDVCASEVDEAKLIEKVREAKRKAIELRVSQLRDLLEQQREQLETNDGGAQRGYAVRLFRKILNNIYIDLTDIRVSFINRQRGLALGLELPTLEVLSTDPGFREAPDGEEVIVSGLSMYKLLRLKGLGVRMSATGSSDLGGAEYVLTPISASLQLAHVPSDQVLRMRLSVATEEIAELAFRRSQVKHLRSVQRSLFEESNRLHALLVPAEDESAILLNAASAQAEYANLYERHMLHELRLAGTSQKPLSPADVERLRLLEASFSVRALAKQRWVVQNKVDALRDTVTKLSAEKEKMERRRSSGSREVASNKAEGSNREPIFTAADREKLLAAMNDETKVETVDLPQRLQFEFVLGKMVVDLVDDRWVDEARKQLLSLSLQEATWRVSVDMVTDHAGRDSTEWSVDSCLGTFRARHAGRSLVRISPTVPCPVPRLASDSSCGSTGPRRKAIPEVSCSAANLVIENKVASDHRLLRVKLTFAPLDLNLLPGALEQLLEFLRSPVTAQQAQPVPSSSPDMVSQMVYEHIPDRFYLEVSMESPVVHIPVAGLGTTTFSTTELKLVTPAACAYNSLLLEVTISSTTLHAVSTAGEQFNMVQPVPIALQIRYNDFDDETSVDVVAQTERLTLSLTPEALQILIAIPAAAASLMSPVTEPASSDQAESARENELRPQPASRAGQFRLNLRVEVNALDVKLIHMREPALFLLIDLPSPGLVLYQQSSPPVLLVDVAKGAAQVSIVNPPHGHSQPLIERVGFTLQVVRRPEGQDQSATHVILSGRHPLLVNLTPTMLRRSMEIAPDFLASLTTDSVAGDKASREAPTPGGALSTKYRVVNLCDCAFQLELQSLHGRCLQMEVPPTGAMWESLDDWILPNFATSIAIRMPTRMGRDGPLEAQPSEKLSLEKAGTVPIPGCDAVAELLLPSDSQRLLVLSGPLRIHNQTELPILLRLHDPVQQEVLLVDVPPTSTCDAALLGEPLPEYKVCSEHAVSAGSSSLHQSGQADGTVLVPPNAVCAVPAFALKQRRASSAAGCNARVVVSLKPFAGGASFTLPVEVGEGISQQTIAAGATSEVHSTTGAVIHLICEVQTSVAGNTPTGSRPVITVVLRPPLIVYNAVPLQGLTLGYGLRMQEQPCKANVVLQAFTKMDIYSFPGQLEDGVLIYLRLGDSNPWTAPVKLKHEDFTADGMQPRQLQLSNQQGGACITLEPLRPYEIRLSSPHWLVDRSGISRPLNIEFHRYGGVLPQADGVTLFPADCLEDTCEIVLRSQCSLFSTKAFRTPSSWGVFPWRTACGSFVFNMQTDDIAPTDVFGATCQVTVLRPRLVLTNASSRDIEVWLSENRVIRLAEGQSQEAHWQVAAGDEATMTTAVCFRPLRAPELNWSGAVMCCDAAAGSTPFLLQASEAEQPAFLQVEAIFGEGEVWSADVAPSRGALAVSFREGSDFVAANRAKRAKVSMKIQPRVAQGATLEASAGDVFIPWGGREIPFGWVAPFNSQERAVDVFLNGRRIPVPDVRRSLSIPVRRLGVAVAVTRRGSQTLLSVEDHDGSAFAGTLASGMQANSALEPWLHRIEVRFDHVGISLIEEVPRPRELFFIDFQLLRFEWRHYQDAVQQVKLAISEVQVDCQLPGRVDARTMDQRREESLGLLGRERPVVILANCGHGEKPFLTLSAQRASTSTSDLLFPYVELALDAIDIAIDDVWLESLLGFLGRAGMDAKKESKTRASTLLQTAGTPIVEAYSVPPMPAVVQVDALQISEVVLTVWCTLSLSNNRFLPPYICAAIRMLSFSGQLTLDGPALKLPARSLPAHRGSMTDFIRGLCSEYAADLIDNAAKALGKSSVLNLPRAPLKLGFMAISYVSDSIGLAVGEAASLLGQLTFDSEYVAQQRQLRVKKQILGITDGVAEAGQSIALGVEGIFDVVRKPMEGARRGGMGGFIAGVGKGVAGTFVKPVSKIGQAISDVGSGIAMQAHTDSIAARRQRARLRRRQPRLLFTHEGLVRPWSQLSAEVQRQLGASIVTGVEEVLQLTQYGNSQTVLLLFSTHLVLAQVELMGLIVPTSGATDFLGDDVCSPVQENMQLGAPSSSASGRSIGASRQAPKGAQGVDLLDAFDETAVKICFQALKPVKTLIYGVQDIAKTLKGRNRECLTSMPSWVSQQARLIQFADLAHVEQCDGGDILRLEDHSGGSVSLPLFAACFGSEAKDALAKGLAAAIETPTRSVSWQHLNHALQEEERNRECD